MTHSGYVKRLPVAEYHAQNRGGTGITAHRPKEEDFVERMFICSSHDDILLFSSTGKVYSIKAYEIPEANRLARGRAFVNIVQIAQDEKINAMIPVEHKTSGFVVFATKKGQIKKTRMREFASIKRNGKIAIKLTNEDKLIAVEFTTGKNEIMIASRTGKCIRFHEKDVRSTGRGTAGVRAMKLSGADCLVDMLIVDKTKDVLTVTSKGFGKRTDIDEYRTQGRAGMGLKAGVFNSVTGYLVSLKQVTDDNDVMVISDSGIIIRMHCTSISKIGRNTKGVRLMRLKNGSVATVAITDRDEEAEAQEAVESVTPEEAAAQALKDGAAETAEVEIPAEEASEKPAEKKKIKSAETTSETKTEKPAAKKKPTKKEQ